MIRESLIGRPVIRPKIQKAKVGICLLIGIMMAALASILMLHQSTNKQIVTMIDDISLLKDYNFNQWGREPGSDSNIFTQSFRLYQYLGGDEVIDEAAFKLTDVSLETNYEFSYENASFGQGNVGLIGLINSWQRVPQNANNATIRNFNLALNKAFSQQTLSPIQSKFPVLFSRVFTTLKHQFLPDFYAEYLWSFFFVYQDLIVETIFQPLGLDAGLQTKLLTDKDFGWASFAGIKPWIKLSLTGFYLTEQFYLIKSRFNLTSDQVDELIGPGSQMAHLTTALNSTIKNKLKSKYKSMCQGAFCNDNELVAAQWGEAFLSTKTLMGDVNINKLTGELNTTHRKHGIEYSQACKYYNNSDNCLDVGQINDLLNTNQTNLFNFSFVNFIVQNKDTPSIIEKLIHLDPPGLGQSVVDYIVDYFYKVYTVGETEQGVFTWVWLVYQNFNQLWSDYQDLFVNNLFGRAFYSRWGSQSTPCKDYFAGTLEKYAVVCDKEGFSLGKDIESYFPYVRAYFFVDRLAFVQATEMTIDDAQTFFSSNQSQFYVQMQEILSDYNKQFSCEGGMCSPQFLTFCQWGSNSILSNLPSKYFPASQTSILQWDTNDTVLHGYNIEYWSIKNQTLSFESVKGVMSYDNYGILGEFSLKNRVDDKKDPQGMLSYLNNILINYVFEGVFITKESDSYFLGYPSQYLTKIKNKEMIEGGRPWISGRVELIKTNNSETIRSHTPTEYDQINSGIYDQKSLRVWKKRLGHLTTGYKYPVSYQNSNLTYTWIDTGRPLNGTNLLGFHTKVTAQDTLTAYVQDLRHNVDFKLSNSISGNKLKFLPVQREEYFVGNDTLDGYYAKMISQESYLVVQTETGQTLEAQIVLDWYLKPGEFLFNIPVSSKAYLFRQSQFFKRSSQEKYNSITKHRQEFKTTRAILLTVAVVCFVGVMVVMILILRWKKNLIRLKEDQDNSNVERINTQPSLVSSVGNHYDNSIVRH